jgi:hypothetical protein
LARTPSFGLDFSNNGLNADPPERLGWGNDGTPLREFASVAIVQHAARMLNRKPGVDFRVPTAEELDALAAYQLALGRQQDFDLPTLVLKGKIASQGRTPLYLDTGNIDEPRHKNCNACHFKWWRYRRSHVQSKKAGISATRQQPTRFQYGRPHKCGRNATCTCPWPASPWRLGVLRDCPARYCANRVPISSTQVPPSITFNSGMKIGRGIQ